MSSYGRLTDAVEVARTADLRGRTVVITGTSSGIGVETARAMATTGADLVLGVRDPSKGEEALDGIGDGGSGSVRMDVLDLREPASVASFAERLDGPVHVLIPNAGVSKTPDSHLPNGLDVRFATNHLGHFLLAVELRRQMAAEGARIVVVSSGAHHGAHVRLDDLQWQVREHNPMLAYAQSKTANILFAQEATRRWGPEGIFANAVLPGSVLTGLQRFHGEAMKRRIGFVAEDGTPNPMLKSAAQAAATSVWAATAPDLQGRGGLVLEDCSEALVVGPDVHPWSGFDPAVADPETANGLWERSLLLLDELGIPVG